MLHGVDTASTAATTTDATAATAATTTDATAATASTAATTTDATAAEAEPGNCRFMELIRENRLRSKW